MNITAFFSLNGTPTTGLSPTLDGWTLDGTLVLDGVAMTEVAGGWYYYNFTTYNSDNDYVFRADGGDSFDDADRYKVATNDISSVAAVTNGKVDVVDGIVDDILVDTGTTLNGLITTINGNVDQSLSTTESNIRGADDDTLKTLSTQLDGIHTVGTGSSAETYTVTSSVTGSPIGDVDVWATTDTAGENRVAQGRTNSNGQVTFYLNAGTYYFWQSKAGYSFSSANPTTVTVS